MKLLFTRAARSDLARLRDFLHRFNPGAARRAAESIKSTAISLTVNPKLGSPVTTPDGEPAGLRDFPVSFGRYGYVMRYRVTDDAVVVLRVWHGRESRGDDDR